MPARLTPIAGATPAEEILMITPTPREPAPATPSQPEVGWVRRGLERRYRDEGMSEEEARATASGILGDPVDWGSDA